MVHMLNEYLGIASVKGETVIQCVKCGNVLCSTKERWKNHVPRLNSPLTHAGPRRSGSGRFEMREYICPKCATVLDVEVALPGDEPLYDEIDISSLPKGSLS
jgi:acetone carboxylase gamma subunit